MNFLSPDHYPTEAFTLPLSTELNREAKYRNKKVEKEYSRQLQKDKKNFKSKEKPSYLLKNRREKPDCKDKKSSERG